MYPKLKKNDPRYPFIMKQPNNLVNFALSISSTTSPPVILYSPESWDKQLRQQARNYCRQQIRIFLHSNQKKVILS